MKYSPFIEVMEVDGEFSLHIQGHAFSNHVKQIFVENFHLPPMMEELNENGYIFTFSKNIDEYTFYRHLKTLTVPYLIQKHKELQK